MKKTKRNHNRRHNNYIPYTKGRNMWGDRAKTRLIVLKKETAFEQMINAIDKVTNSKNQIEYTFDARCFSDCPEEYVKIMKRVEMYMSNKTRSKNLPFAVGNVGAA